MAGSITAPALIGITATDVPVKGLSPRKYTEYSRLTRSPDVGAGFKPAPTPRVCLNIRYERYNK